MLQGDGCFLYFRPFTRWHHTCATIHQLEELSRCENCKDHNFMPVLDNSTNVINEFGWYNYHILY